MDSLNHLIRPRQQFVWKRDPNLFCRLEANDEFKPHRLLYRKISRLGSLENPVYIVGGLAVLVIQIRPIGHETALIDKLLLLVNSRQSVFNGKLDDPLSFGEKGAKDDRHNRAHLLLLCSLKGAL